MTNTDPKYYQFPHGVQLIDITENLSGNGAQAVQYVVRATRTDGVTKGKTTEEILEDLHKAAWFIDREIDRLNTVYPADTGVYDNNGFGDW